MGVRVRGVGWGEGSCLTRCKYISPFANKFANIGHRTSKTGGEEGGQVRAGLDGDWGGGGGGGRAIPWADKERF